MDGGDGGGAPPTPYPWHLIVRNGTDDQGFYATLVACLDGRVSLPTASCVGFCSGRCALNDAETGAYTLNGVRVVGLSDASRLFRHRVCCGTVPIFLLPPGVSGESSDTFATGFGRCCGFEVQWLPSDRKTWYLHRHAAQSTYKWTTQVPDGSIAQWSNGLTCKFVYHCHLRSTYSTDKGHPMTTLCRGWSEGGFARHVVTWWELGLQSHSSRAGAGGGAAALVYVKDATRTQEALLLLLADRFGIRLETPKDRKVLSVAVEWVWSLKEQMSLSDRVRRVMRVASWTPAQLHTAFVRIVHHVRGDSPVDKDRLAPEACSVLVRICGLGIAHAHTLLECADLQASAPGPGLSVPLLILHAKGIMLGRGTHRLPLRKTVLIKKTRTAALEPVSHDECVTGVTPLCNTQVYIERRYGGDTDSSKRQRRANGVPCDEDDSARTLVYYELTDDWQSGHHALDDRLWSMCTYQQPPPPTAPAVETGTATTPRRYRGVSLDAALARLAIGAGAGAGGGGAAGASEPRAD